MELIDYVVFDRIQVIDGEIKDIHTFYYPGRSDLAALTA